MFDLVGGVAKLLERGPAGCGEADRVSSAVDGIGCAFDQPPSFEGIEQGYGVAWVDAHESA